VRYTVEYFNNTDTNIIAPRIGYFRITQDNEFEIVRAGWLGSFNDMDFNTYSPDVSDDLPVMQHNSSGEFTFDWSYDSVWKRRMESFYLQVTQNAHEYLFAG
jgi:predicted N-acyltransferase